MTEQEKLYQLYKAQVNQINSGSQSSDFDQIAFPMVRRVFSSILGPTSDQIKEIEDRIKVENRDNKIESITEEKEFIQKTLENDEEYKKLQENSLISVKPLSAPSANLFYLDFTYGTSSN